MGGGESKQKEGWEGSRSGRVLQHDPHFLRLSVGEKLAVCSALDRAVPCAQVDGRGGGNMKLHVDFELLFQPADSLSSALADSMKAKLNGNFEVGAVARLLIDVHHNGIGGMKDLISSWPSLDDEERVLAVEIAVEDELGSCLSSDMKNVKGVKPRPSPSLNSSIVEVKSEAGFAQERRLDSMLHVHFVLSRRVAHLFGHTNSRHALPAGLDKEVDEVGAVWRSRVLSPADIVYLAQSLPTACTKKWKLLFSSEVHGLSFSRLLKQVVGKGPSLVVIKDEKGQVFGGYAAEAWKKRPTFFGDGSTLKRDKDVEDFGFGPIHRGAEDEYHPSPFLFSLYPRRRVYRPTGANSNYQWLQAGTESLPNGIGMGGQEGFFGLFVSEKFDACYSRGVSSTFGNPSLVGADPLFAPRMIEVWGCLGSKLEGEGSGNANMSTSVLDDRETRMLLDLVGRTGVSNDVRLGPNEEVEKAAPKEGLTGPVGKVLIWDPTAK